MLQDAQELRPILVDEASQGLDLLLRDRARKAYVLARANLQPRLPFVGTLPAPPLPPVLVPGRGLMPVQEFVDLFFPRLTDEQEVLLDTQLELLGAILGASPEEFGKFDLQTIPQLFLNPTQQIQELQRTAAKVAASSTEFSIVQSLILEIIDKLAVSLAARADVPVSTLFPLLAQDGFLRNRTEDSVETMVSMPQTAVTWKSSTNSDEAQPDLTVQGDDTNSIEHHEPDRHDSGSASIPDRTVVVNRSSRVQMVDLVQ